MAATLESVKGRMDDLTPYYRRRLSMLPAQQRKVVCAMARLGCWMNSGQVAMESRLEPRAAATALTRLKAKGYVHHENRRWTLEDPWLGAWYRMRRGDFTNIPDANMPVAPSIWDSLLLANGESIGASQGNNKSVKYLPH